MIKAPELAYKKTGTNPTFLSVTLPDWIKKDDFIFVFGKDLRCYGSQKVENNPQFLAAWGADQFDSGFTFREPIKIGVWKKDTNTFNLLEGNCVNWQGAEVEPYYMSLNLLKFEVTGIAGQVDLVVDEQLTASELSFQHIPEAMDIYKDENLFFKVLSTNVENVQVEVIQGAGELITVDRWIGKGVDGHSVNRKYIASELDEVVMFKATAENIYTDEVITKWQSIAVTNSKPKEEEPQEPEQKMEVYKTDQFRLFMKPFKTFGNFIFIESLIDEPVWVSIIFTTEAGGRKSSTLRSESNGGRGICVDEIKSIEVYRLWVDRKRQNVERKKIEL